MKKIIVCFLCLLCAALPAWAQELRPKLSDPQAQAVQRLSVMSQQDEALDGVPYNGGFVRGRGCQPVSIANGLIAAFGVEDRQTAIELVKEATQVLVVPWERGTGRMELRRIVNLFDPEERKAEAQEFAHLAALFEGYEGHIAVLDETLSADMAEAHFAKRSTGMLVGDMQVHPDWTALLEIVDRLYAMDMKDAVMTLASVGVGNEESRAPLSTGKNGHYLTLMLVVGSFAREGRMYVLDSLPRALAGEESGGELVLRQHYPFAKKKSGFASEFDARRISETVIELKVAAQEQWREADIKRKNRMLGSLTLFGPGVMTISWEQDAQ